jgi:hypothetical protein
LPLWENESAGKAITDKVAVPLAVHPCAERAVTEYAVVTCWFTIIAAPVRLPGLQV